MTDHKTAVNIWLQPYFPLSSSVPECLRCMVRHTVMAKHIFTLLLSLSVMMLLLFAVQ